MRNIVGLAFLGLFFLMISCEKDTEHSHQHEAKIVRKLQINDLPPLLRNDIQHKKQNNANYRTEQNYLDLINYDNITEITQRNGSKAYTFSLNITELDKLTNLVILEKNGEYEYRLIEYSSEHIEQWKNDIQNKHLSDIDIDITVTSLSNGGAICITDGYICPSGMHTTGQELQCHYTFSEWSYFLMQAPCPLDNDGGPGGGSSGQGNNGNNPPGNEEPEDPFTEPVFPTLSPAIFDFFNDLGSTQSSFLNANPYIRTQIVNYLLLNIRNDVISPQAQEFANEALNTLIAGGDVDFNFQVIIDPSFENNTTLMNVFNEFGSFPTFNSYLQNFEGSFSVAHLKLSASSTLPSNVNAETTRPQNYLITITFNTNNLNRPNLSIARTMMHEMIHAEIFRKMLSCSGLPHVNFNNYTQQQWVNYITNLQNSFPGIYDYYIRWAVQNQNPSAQQHEMMAQHYRSVIVQSLMEYDNSHPSELYEALAWVGLKDTTTWNNLSQTERDNINLIISNFEN